MALYAFEELEEIPVEPLSVQDPSSMVSDVASPIAESCEVDVDTE